MALRFPAARSCRIAILLTAITAVMPLPVLAQDPGAAPSKQQKKLPEAGEQLLEAIRLEPQYYAAHLKLGEILITEGKPSEALSHLRQAARSPDQSLSESALALMKHVAP